MTKEKALGTSEGNVNAQDGTLIENVTIVNGDDQPFADEPTDETPPPAQPIRFENIPHFLRNLRQWVVWKYKYRNNRLTKPPYQTSGKFAKSNDPSTWNYFIECWKASKTGQFSGVGFCFAEGDGLCGIDLDHCFDANADLEPWAQTILEQFDGTYVEHSPSGDGLHIWCYGRPIRTGQKKWKKAGTDIEQGIEVYDYRSPRYLTVTGNVVSAKDILDCQPGLDSLYGQYWAQPHEEPKQAKNRDGQADVELVRKALAFIPSDDYDKWIEIGMALKASGLDVGLWDEWSQGSPKYVPGMCAGKWRTFNGNRIGLGTVFYYAKQHGFIFPNGAASGFKIANNSTGIGHLHIARATLNTYGNGNLIFGQGRFYLWSGNVWTQCDEQEIQNRIIQTYESMSLGEKATASSVMSVLKLMKSELFIPDANFNRSCETINCLNGELYLNGASWVLAPPVREHYKLSLIPIEYDASAKAPRFEQFLDEIFENDTDHEQKKKVVLQFIGYSLTHTCSLERFIVLVGEGANGKSVLLSVVENLVGLENVAGVDPTQFDNKFQRAHLRGKLANIVTELRQGLEINDAALKSLVSGELTTAEEKYRDPFNFRPYAKHWLATNHLPHTRDTTYAFFRRAIVLEFSRRFEGEDCNPHLAAELKEELPGIFNLALDGLKLLILEGRFAEPESSLAAKARWQMDVDQVAQFVSERCKTGTYMVITAKDLYIEYLEWAKESGITKTLGKNAFGRRLTAMGIKEGTGTGGTRIRRGVEIDYEKKN